MGETQKKRACERRSHVLTQSRQGEPPVLHKPEPEKARKVGGCLDEGKLCDSLTYEVVTAFEQYALQAFEDNAFDYLLKPVEPERLDKTLARLKKRTQPQTDIDAIASPTLVHIPCVGHQRILLLPESDIHFAYSDVAGVHVRSLEHKQTRSSH